MRHAAALHLSHRYGDVAAVEDVSFVANGGTVTALIGPTGCGKSTILRIFAGLVTPTSGDVTLDAASIVGRPGNASFMPQGDTLLPWRTALANATLGAAIRGVDPAAADAQARNLFARFGLTGFEDTWPAALSGGMRQRVALLRTILSGPDLLLLDEPFGALDAITRIDLQGWLGALLHDTGRTTLLVTHDIDEALRLADRVLLFSPRPARVIEAVDVPGPRPRTADRVTQQDFAMLKRRILATLQRASR